MTTSADINLIEYSLQSLQDRGITADQIQTFLDGDAPAASAGGSNHDAVVPPDATLDDLIQHARLSLPRDTRLAHVGALRFLANGWTIGVEEYEDAAAVLRKLDLPVPDPDDLTRRSDGHDRELLVMWAGYGDRPVRTIQRASLDVAIPRKRAAALTEQRRRDRLRERHELPPTTTNWNGNGAVEKLIAALRWVAQVMRGSSQLNSSYQPTKDVRMPRRGDSTRRPMDDEELVEVYEVLSLHSDDPELARLLFRFHLWTAHRPCAARNLTIDGIDVEQCTIAARTKYAVDHVVPAPRELCEQLLAFAHSRGSTEGDDPVLRTKNQARSHDGLAHLNTNAYGRLHDTVHEHLEWAAEEAWGFYWLRHTAKARICDIGGFDCGIALLGHDEKLAIERYGRASLGKLAWAVSIMTDRPHPLAVEPADIRAVGSL